MRHDWIFDVLNDLRRYAEKNDLPNIATETTRLLDIARKELTEKTRAEQIVVDQTYPNHGGIKPLSGNKNTK
jgi:hypothetical protein